LTKDIEAPPRRFDRETYRRRHTAERRFNRLKGLRGVTTRYDKTATSYEAAVFLAVPALGKTRLKTDPAAVTGNVHVRRGTVTPGMAPGVTQADRGDSPPPGH
jgi:hypothetical protein